CVCGQPVRWHNPHTDKFLRRTNCARRAKDRLFFPDGDCLIPEALRLTVLASAAGGVFAAASRNPWWADVPPTSRRDTGHGACPFATGGSSSTGASGPAAPASSGGGGTAASAAHC